MSSESLSGAALEVGVFAPTLGSTDEWMTKEDKIVASCSGRRVSPTMREYAGSLGVKLKSEIRHRKIS